MTLYQVWREENGNLIPLGEVDDRRPEHAVEQVVRQKHEAGEDTANGTYVAALKSAVTRIEANIEPSVKVSINSDREIKPRKQRQDGQPAEPQAVPA